MKSFSRELFEACQSSGNNPEGRVARSVLSSLEETTENS